MVKKRILFTSLMLLQVLLCGGLATAGGCNCICFENHASQGHEPLGVPGCQSCLVLRSFHPGPCTNRRRHYITGASPPARSFYLPSVHAQRPWYAHS